MTRRCSWCARPLRWWQYRECRRCRMAGQHHPWGGLTSPPCGRGSRADAEPDRWRWTL